MSQLVNAGWLCSGPEYLFVCFFVQSVRENTLFVVHLVEISGNRSFLLFVMPVSFVHLNTSGSRLK